MIQKIKSGQPYKNSTKVSSATVTGQYAAFPAGFDAQNVANRNNLTYGNRNLPLLVSASGLSQSFYIPDGDHSLVVTASSWGSAALEVSFDNITFMPAENSNSPIVFVSNKSIIISGNLFYRLNVSSYTDTITVNSRIADKV
jgi:hypothetical protein